jgi:hypothetical protein
MASPRLAERETTQPIPDTMRQAAEERGRRRSTSLFFAHLKLFTARAAIEATRVLLACWIEAWLPYLRHGQLQTALPSQPR